MVRHAPIHRRSGHSDIAICCGRNARGSSPSTSVVPLSNQVTTLNHKRFKGLKMFSDGHLASAFSSTNPPTIASTSANHHCPFAACSIPSSTHLKLIGLHLWSPPPLQSFCVCRFIF